MSNKDVDARIVGKFDGVNITSKGTVDLKFKFPYDEFTNYIKALGMLNNNILVSTQIPPMDEIELGYYIIKSFNLNGDGEVKFCLSTTTENAEMSNINSLSVERGNNVVINLKANVDLDEESEEDSADDWGEDDLEEETVAEDWQDNDSWGDEDEENKIDDEWE